MNADTAKRSALAVAGFLSMTFVGMAIPVALLVANSGAKANVGGWRSLVSTPVGASILLVTWVLIVGGALWYGTRTDDKFFRGAYFGSLVVLGPALLVVAMVTLVKH